MATKEQIRELRYIYLRQYREDPYTESGKPTKHYIEWLENRSVRQSSRESAKRYLENLLKKGEF